MIKRSTTQASFPAMSTTVQIIGVDVSPSAIREAELIGRDLVDIWDRTFNRFRPDSELCRVNDGRGRPVVTSRLFRDVLVTALDGARLTGNRFDPSILPALEAAGYDRDIASVRRGGSGHGPARKRAPAPHPASIEINHAAGTVRIPDGIRLDLGGIAKGAFVDRLTAAVQTWPGGCVDAGGDMLVWGLPPAGDHWIVGIEDPVWPETDCAVLEVRRTPVAIATSGTNRRRWRIAGRDAHHIVDPTTSQPLTGPIRSATTVAANAVTAEIASKALLVAAARGEAIAAWGSELSLIATSVTPSGNAAIRATAHTSIATEDNHEPPCIVHTFDSALHCT
jgi:thiamine biosynthesis lipoprotein